MNDHSASTDSCRSARSIPRARDRAIPEPLDDVPRLRAAGGVGGAHPGPITVTPDKLRVDQRCYTRFSWSASRCKSSYRSVAAHCGDQVVFHVVCDAVGDAVARSGERIRTIAFQIDATVTYEEPSRLHIHHVGM